MDALPEIFAITDAFFEFDCSDLCYASIKLLSAMGYPIKPHDDIGNQKIENFIYFTVQNKVHYNERKRMNERTLSPVNSPAILKEKQERTGNINGFTRKKENMGAENIRISFKWCECYSLVRTE